ncbi:MAG: hypothetical protein CMP23_13590 [Rickettsiales bacterium]|nr:hypothetical protein [Rickettsiales bacterium]
MKLLSAVLVGLAALSLWGCATVPIALRVGSSQAVQDPSSKGLERGDVLMAVQRGPGHSSHDLIRIRSSRVDDEPQVLVQELGRVAAAVGALAVSVDARWLAVEQRRAEDEQVTVRLGSFDPGGAWRGLAEGPAGCHSPVFGMQNRRLYLVCEPQGRQPAAILEWDLLDGSQLMLVGEHPRTLVAAGSEGDLYWVEERGAETVVLRRPQDQLPFVTHRLFGRVRALWPQQDGSLVAEYGVPGARGQLARLLSSGLVRDEPGPQAQLMMAEAGAPAYLSPEGRWLISSCAFEPCGLLDFSTAGGEPTSLHLLGVPTALTMVSNWAGAVQHTEDLATAPASVLSSHSAAEVSVLGVSLKMPLERAFSELDRGGRHPYWISAKGPRGRPGGIGVGWTTAGYCISFLSDERGLVSVIDLRGCAAEYLSVQLQPLLRREQLSLGAVELASSFLGPGVAVSVGSGSSQAAEPKLQRTRIQYHAPDRGYEFEAEIEMMLPEGDSVFRTRLLGGEVRLRLKSPGRPQAAILGVP